mmetsp:Transcript_34804/g.81206  ORF Transcript_34804/g.81206 Transcript_34804/m.81206 type:complete len:214 (-) Transcript_34804:77-718(-)
MDSRVSGWMALVSMFKTFKEPLERSDTARMAASGSCKLLQPKSNCSMCLLLSMATANFGEMSGSTFPSGIFRLVKSNFTKVRSSRCALCTIHIIQLPIWDDLLATASFSRSWSSPASLHANTRFTKSSSIDCTHWSAAFETFAVEGITSSVCASACATWAAARATAASRSRLLRRRPKFALCSSQAFFKHQPRPMSSKTFSMVAQASVQVRTR